MFTGGFGENPFPTMQVGRIQFLMVIGLGSLFPCWLSPQGHSASRSCPLDFSHGTHHLQSQQWCINSTSSYALKLCGFYLYLLLLPARESSFLLRTHVIRSITSLVSVGVRIPSVPCHMGLPNTATCFIKMCKPRRRGKLQSHVM